MFEISSFPELIPLHAITVMSLLFGQLMSIARRDKIVDLFTLICSKKSLFWSKTNNVAPFTSPLVVMSLPSEFIAFNTTENGTSACSITSLVVATTSFESSVQAENDKTVKITETANTQFAKKLPFLMTLLFICFTLNLSDLVFFDRPSTVFPYHYIANVCIKIIGCIFYDGYFYQKSG